MKRRGFIKTTSLGCLAIGLGSGFQKPKTHVLTLSFDDGFKKSFYKTAEIFEKYDLKACLNVIASGHLSEFEPPDDYIKNNLMGDFNDWNTLQSRGHEIMPHGWQHENLSQLPLNDAKKLIDRCLDYFEEHLEGFVLKKAIYNFAFNASTAELDDYLLSKVRAVRHMGKPEINKIPSNSEPLVLGCTLNGSGNIDEWVEKHVNTFLSSKQGGWLILNTHGLDNEGWGPMSSVYLEELLKRLVQVNTLDVLPTGEVLKKYT